MPRLLRLLRSLGNAGAVANAGVLLERRRREDREVSSLARRLDALGPATGSTSVAA